MALRTTSLGVPSFMCVGAQKAGTTTLHALLNTHSQIFLPLCKEVHYFSLHYHQGMDWYRSHFSLANSNQCIGEITPYYMFHPYAALRIAEDLGKIKIIILLRDPVNRTLSHYGHSCRLGFENLPLEEALNKEDIRLTGFLDELKNSCGIHKNHQECSYLSRSLYRSQVQQYWKIFGRNNVLLLPSESLFSRPLESMQIIFSFLGLDSHLMPSSSILNVHANKAIASGSKEVVHNSLVISKLRADLEDSYLFVRDELGWENSLPWNWNL